MVTYSDLFQFGILICAIIGLCLSIESNNRPLKGRRFLKLFD